MLRQLQGSESKALEEMVSRITGLLASASPVLGVSLQVPPSVAFEFARASVVLSSIMLSIVVPRMHYGSLSPRIP